MVALHSNIGRASASLFIYWRASHRSISWLGNRCVVPSAGFSTIRQDVDLFQHIQSHNFFTPPIPSALSIPDGFPFNIGKTGLMPYDISLRRLYGKDTIYIEVNKVNFDRVPSLQMSGLIFNGHQFMKFRMVAQPDDVRIYIITIGDGCRRHVDGSERYLEAKGIKPSTIGTLFDYLRNKMIPSKDQFPFEIKDGPEKGLLTLRRKLEDEIIIVEVRAVDEKKILDELADYEEAESVKSLKLCLDELYRNDFEEKMKVFEDENLGNADEVGGIGCLLMTANIYSRHGYTKRIKLDVFALPDRIFVPGISLSDSSRNSLKTYETYFKDRGIHADTMNFMINYIAHLMGAQEHDVKVEPAPKIFGLFNESQVKAAKCEANQRFIGEYWDVR